MKTSVLNFTTYLSLADIICAGQAALERGMELVGVHIDFCAAFDRLNHTVLLPKWRDVGVVGVVLDVADGFFSGG